MRQALNVEMLDSRWNMLYYAKEWCISNVLNDLNSVSTYFYFCNSWWANFNSLYVCVRGKVECILRMTMKKELQFFLFIVPMRLFLLFSFAWRKNIVYKYMRIEWVSQQNKNDSTIIMNGNEPTMIIIYVRAI